MSWNCKTWKGEWSGIQMRKSLDGDGLRRSEAYPKGDTASFDKSHTRQDLASDGCRAILLSSKIGGLEAATGSQ